LAVSLVRVLQTTQQTLSHTFYVDGVATDAAGDVTYAVKRLDGTVVTGGTATHPGVGTYAFLLPATETQDLDSYSVDWTGTFGGAAATVRDFVEIVGGFMFSVDDARNMPPVLNAVVYPNALVARKRTAVEVQAERICNVAFVPRFKRRALGGNGSPYLKLPDLLIRAVRAVSVDGVAWSAGQVEAAGFGDSGVLTMNTIGAPSGVWPIGQRNIIVEYEHGMDQADDDLAEAGVIHLRSRLTGGDTSVPYRAISFQSIEGGTYRLSTPSKQKTGIPIVDAAYEAARIDPGGFA